MATYYVWKPDQGSCEECSKRIIAVGAERAAERWAAWDDVQSAEYDIVSGNEAEVCVKSATTGEVRVFIVSGESVPSYTAIEKQ